MKYHVTPDGPRKCRAEQGQCPYAAAGQPHFAKQEEAQAHFEQTMEESFGAAPSVKRGEKVRQAAYRTQDRVAEKITESRAAAARATQRAKDSFRNTTQKASDTTRETSLKVAQFAGNQTENLKSRAAAQGRSTAFAAQYYFQPAKPYVQTAVRTAAASAKIVGRDIAAGAKRLNERYQITSRVSRALKKVTRPVSDYVRSRATLVSRFAKSDLAENKRKLPEKVLSKPRAATKDEQTILNVVHLDGKNQGLFDFDLISSRIHERAAAEEKATVDAS